MKKYFLLLLFTAISYAQTNGVTKLKITANPEKTAATRVVVQDAATGEVGYVNKTTIVTLDATNTTTGKIQLSGDLGGTATLPTVPGLATKENTIAPGTTSQYYRGDKTWQTLDKTAVGLGNVDNTSDLNKPISTATQTALNLKENSANKNVANGYAGLGSDGKLISSQLPSITISDTFVVGSQSAMLAVTAETGDVAVRTDLNKSFILKGTNPAVLTDWQELLSPTSTVTSVFGRTGAVTAQSGDYTTAQVTETTNKKYQTDAQALYNDATSSIQTQLNNKIAGDGTTNYVSKFFGTKLIGNSLLYDNGSSVRLGTTAGAGDELLMVSMNGTTNTQAINVKDQNASANASTFMVFRKSDDTFLGNIRRNGTENSLYVGGNENLILGTGGNTERLRVNSSGQLEVKGGSTAANAQALITNSDTDFNFYASNTSGVNKNINFLYNGGSGQAMKIATNGFVSIGASSPAQKLDVFGISRISNTTPALQLFNTTSGDNWGTIQGEADAGTGGKMVFYTKRNGNSENAKMIITESGNVGIGTTNPDGKLNVYTGASVTNATAFNAGDGSNSLKYLPYTGAGSYNDLSVAGGGLLLGNINSKLAIGTWNGTGIQFGPINTLISGNVGIGTSAPSGKLTVKENYTSLEFNTEQYKSQILSFDRDLGSYRNLEFRGGDFIFSPSDSEKMRLNSSGNLTVAGSVTATGFFQSSDLRLKDIISRDGDVIKYKWKDKRDNKIHIGYVAQEVQKENPDQVNADDKGILSVNYIEILVEKIRKLEKEIELLKAK